MSRIWDDNNYENSKTGNPIWKCRCGWVPSGDRFYCDNCGEHISKWKLEGNKMNISKVKKEIDKNLKDLEKQKHISEFYNSLLKSVEEVGGSTHWITEETTLKELADTLAQNNIRFVYNGKSYRVYDSNDSYVHDRDQY